MGELIASVTGLLRAFLAKNRITPELVVGWRAFQLTSSPGWNVPTHVDRHILKQFGLYLQKGIWPSFMVNSLEIIFDVPGSATAGWDLSVDTRDFRRGRKRVRLTSLPLSKIGDVPLVYRRDVPDDATIKEVVVKQEPTGEWFAVLGIETENDAPTKPENPEKCVGIDVGILKYAHDSDGTAVEGPDLSEERERLERAQRDLSRKEYGSANYRKQQRVVAQRHADLKRKRRDFLHKLSNYYAQEYDLVAVEDLDAKGLMELPSNSRNRAGAAWGTFLRMLEYKCEREGSPPSIREERRRSVPNVASKPRSRCGSASTRVPRADSRRTVTSTRRTTSFHADSIK